MSQTFEISVDEMREFLDKILEKLHELMGRAIKKNDTELLTKVSSLLNELSYIKKEFSEEKVDLRGFFEFVEKFKDAPEELLDILTIPEIPFTTGAGKRIVESVVGFRGLGIETIDHFIKDISYEGVTPQPEEEIENFSLTTFMYRSPPFELTRCPYEGTPEDKMLNDIIGPRFIWFLKPSQIKRGLWEAFIQKTAGDRYFYYYILLGKYTRFRNIIIPNEIKLLDISRKCLEFELNKPRVFIKFGSKKFEREFKAASETSVSERSKKREFLKRIEKLSIHVPTRPKLRTDYVYFCYKGMAISTDPFDFDECPFKECPFKKAGQCNGKRFWSGNYGIRKPFPKVYPLRKIRPLQEGILTLEDSIFKPNDIMKIKFFEKYRIGSSWDGVELGTWFIRARPIVRIYFHRRGKIGYVIPTSVMSISFTKEWLDKVITDILKNDKRIRKHIALKMILKKRLGRFFNYTRAKSLIEEELVKKKGENYELYQKYLNGKLDEDIVNFSREVLLHSLTHMLLHYLLKKIAGVDFSFIIARHFSEEGIILLAENAKNGGLGIIDTIRREVENNGFVSFIINFSQWAKSFLEKHKKEFERLSKERQKEASQLITKALILAEKPVKEKITKLDEKIKKFKEELQQSNIELDITLARLIFLISHRISDEEISGIEEYIDDLLEKHGFNLCIDGCNGCVRLEKYCNEGTSQILTTSRELLYSFLTSVLSQIKKGISYSGRDVGKIIEPIIFGSRQEIKIAVPFISPKYAEKLVEMARRGVKIKILTEIPESESSIKEFEYHLKALKVLKNSREKNLEVKLIDKLHLKVYISDSRIAVTGSTNLTEHGFYKNLERIEVKIHPEAVNELLKEFSEYWEKASPLQNCF